MTTFTKYERRTTKDGSVERTSRTIDALQPLADAVRQLEQSADRYLAAREARQAAEREEPLREIRQYLTRPIQAFELDETASICRRYPIFGDRP
jgi:hypothetical protein